MKNLGRVLFTSLGPKFDASQFSNILNLENVGTAALCVVSSCALCQIIFFHFCFIVTISATVYQSTFAQ